MSVTKIEVFGVPLSRCRAKAWYEQHKMELVTLPPPEGRGFRCRKEIDQMLNELGKQITEINTANGWQVLKPEDWSKNVFYEDWDFEEPHIPTDESYWRVFARHKVTNRYVIGSGQSQKQAVEDCKHNILSNLDVNTYRVPAALALIHSEVSEALEAFRIDDKENFQEELADIIIRVLDCGAGLGFDLDAAVEAKLAKNRGRGYKHGDKRL